MFHAINHEEMFKQPTKSLRIRDTGDSFEATLVGFGILEGSTSLIVIDNDGRVHNVSMRKAVVKK